MPSLLDQPPEILNEITQWLDFDSIIRIRSVCWGLNRFMEKCPRTQTVTVPISEISYPDNYAEFDITGQLVSFAIVDKDPEYFRRSIDYTIYRDLGLIVQVWSKQDMGYEVTYRVIKVDTRDLGVRVTRKGPGYSIIYMEKVITRICIYLSGRSNDTTIHKTLDYWSMHARGKSVDYTIKCKSPVDVNIVLCTL